MTTIATHSGVFHADESLAIFMLQQLPQYKNAKVIRTRDPLLIDQADIVVDVGAVYDPKIHRYDHHQRGFTETFSASYDIKLSSAGLVYKHFGKQVIAEMLNWKLDHPQLDFIYQKVYVDLILMFDGVDNGVSQYPDEIEPRYSDGTCISARISRLNPQWNQVNSDEIIFSQFLKAVQTTGEELTHKLHSIAFSWLPARQFVENSFSKRFDVHPSGKIIFLPNYCPWESHLFDLEKENSIEKDQLPLYVLFEDSFKTFRVKAVAIEPGSFQTRKPLPEPWRGVRDEELSKLTGVDGCIFVHAAGFIGGAKSKEAVLRLATIALQF